MRNDKKKPALVAIAMLATLLATLVVASVWEIDAGRQRVQDCQDAVASLNWTQPRLRDRGFSGDDECWGIDTTGEPRKVY